MTVCAERAPERGDRAAPRRSWPRRRRAGRARASADRAGAAIPRTSRGSETSATQRDAPSAGSASAHAEARLAAAPRPALCVRRVSDASWRGGLQLARAPAARASRAAARSAARGSCCRGQRAVQRDLQDVRQLAVDRRDRSRHRPFDDLPSGVGGCDVERIGERRRRRTAPAAADTVRRRAPARSSVRAASRKSIELVGGLRLIAVAR